MEGQIREEDLSDMSPEQILELQKQNCIFCKIIKGEIPSKKIYEDAYSICILDINPANKGHVLILPKEHYQIMPQIPPDVLGNLFLTAKKISQVILKSMIVSGTNIFIANGVLAGQRAPHFMIHLIPRDENDGLFDFTINRLEDKDLLSLKDRLIPAINNLFGKKTLPGQITKYSENENFTAKKINDQAQPKQKKIIDSDFVDDTESEKSQKKQYIQKTVNKKELKKKKAKTKNKIDKTNQYVEVKSEEVNNKPKPDLDAISRLLIGR